MCHCARMFDETFGTSKRYGKSNNTNWLQTLNSSFVKMISSYLNKTNGRINWTNIECNHTTEHSHQSFSDRMIGMRLQSRIPYFHYLKKTLKRSQHRKRADSPYHVRREIVQLQTPIRCIVSFAMVMFWDRELREMLRMVTGKKSDKSIITDSDEPLSIQSLVDAILAFANSLNFLSLYIRQLNPNVHRCILSWNMRSSILNVVLYNILSLFIATPTPYMETEANYRRTIVNRSNVQYDSRWLIINSPTMQHKVGAKSNRLQ